MFVYVLLFMMVLMFSTQHPQTFSCTTLKNRQRTCSCYYNYNTAAWEIFVSSFLWGTLCNWAEKPQDGSQLMHISNSKFALLQTKQPSAVSVNVFLFWVNSFDPLLWFDYFGLTDHIWIKSIIMWIQFQYAFKITGGNIITDL